MFDLFKMSFYSRFLFDIDNNMEDKPIANDKPGKCFRIFCGEKKSSSINSYFFLCQLNTLIQFC